MKLILENWRKFVEHQQPITLDESQLLPEILKFNLNEELLSEVETDPEALSIAEIEKVPPAQIIAVYDELVSKQSDTADQARAGRQKQRKQDQSDVSAKIDKHFYSGVFNKVLNAAKLAINNLLGTNLSAFDEESAEEQEELLRRKVNDNIMDEFSPLEREIIRSIFLFTGANVPSVRTPASFDEEQAKILGFINKSITAKFTPTRETYEKANIILSKLQQKEIEDAPEAFRGLMLPIQSDKFVPIAAYQVGRSINVGTFISFSTDYRVSWEVFSGETNPDEGKVSTMFVVPEGKLKRGIAVNEFSAARGEDEIISSGEFKITRMGVASEDMNDWESNQFNSFEDLYNNFEFGGVSFKDFYEHTGYGSASEMARDKPKVYQFFLDKAKVVIEMEQL
jgi:hypothetical protein